jgi:hypothetical protein
LHSWLHLGCCALRLGHHWVRVRRAWLGRLAGAAYQQRRGQNRFIASSRACGAPVHVSSQKGGVMRCPCCLGTKESHSDLFKIDTPLYPHIAAVHGGKCSVLIRAPVR